ncbi:hypothetical protein EVAR_60347_1 [Eumeta japonica]|uniref:Uncharacterized protein n=1 Tax=Eumeta variegata TaxID=151549 RepID=A0A4C1ZPF8_EUMVA|nr:hypothetical protein EVAR_60347_1 [Eumeta japonica]
MNSFISYGRCTLSIIILAPIPLWILTLLLFMSVCFTLDSDRGPAFDSDLGTTHFNSIHTLNSNLSEILDFGLAARTACGSNFAISYNSDLDGAVLFTVWHY